MAAPYETTGARARRPTAPHDDRTLLFGPRAVGGAGADGSTSNAAGGNGVSGVGVRYDAAETELMEQRNGMAVDSLRDRVGDMRHVSSLH